jgi:hypothetical protein
MIRLTKIFQRLSIFIAAILAEPTIDGEADLSSVLHRVHDWMEKSQQQASASFQPEDPFEELCCLLESYQGNTADLRTKVEELSMACQYFLTVIEPLWEESQRRDEVSEDTVAKFLENFRNV